MKKQQIAIIGAGIGGLTTAIALHKKGFSNITIFERRATATTMGAGLVLWANAIKVLTQLDLLASIEKIGGKLTAMDRYTSENEFLGAVDVTTINSIIGATSYAVSRADLQKVLLAKVESLNISISYNSHVTTIETHQQKATLVFDTDTRITPDIVIGADGRMQSAARTYVQGDNKPVYQNFVNWIGIVETNEATFLDTKALDYWGVGQRFGLVPINTHKAYWAGGMALPLNAPQKKGNYKEEMHNMFASWSPKIKEVIALTPSENIKYIEVFDHNPNQQWHKNNVCLLGDAAHAALPTSGQGACQAIEDAWHLANCLVTEESIATDFKSFKTLRFNKTTNITMAGRNLATSLFNTDASYCKQRNAQAKQTDYKTTSQSIAQLWGSGL
jgi:2-polyprenyl-6-methoxyphenol hydroxylase-like FAD-dependent oxidoreductase